MVGNVGNILDAAQSARLLALQKTARQLDVASARLATGQKVLSALDNPSSYFLARTLRSRAGDLTRLLDGIGQNIRVIEEADHGVKAQLKLLDQAESYLQDIVKKYYADELPPSPTGLAPNETLVTISGSGDFITYQPGQDLNIGTVSVPNSEEVTFSGNLWKRKAFNYTITSETVLTFDYRSTLQPEISSIGFDNDNSYTNDSNRYFIYGSQNTGIATPVPYNTYDYTGAGAWQQIEIPVGTHFTGNFNYINIIHDDDAAPYGNASFRRIILREGPKQQALDFTQFKDGYRQILNQIDDLARDAQYRGVNLLKGDDMTTVFNETGTSKLVTEGINATFAGLGLNADDFRSINSIEAKLVQVRAARETLRGFGSTLSNDLNIIQIRQEFTQGSINTHKAGADDLTLGDPNEEGANLLALQTRQQLQVAVLALRPPNIFSILS